MGEDASAPRSAELTLGERATIDGMYLRLASSNHYELLGVDRAADRRSLRDAYFALSQQFHPDAWYGRPLGDWKARIEMIFREVTRAYEVLSNRNTRATYDQTLGPAPAGVSTPAPTGRLSTEPPHPVAHENPVRVPTPPAFDPSAPIIPDRRVAPPVTEKRPIPPAFASAVDHDAALRAARENLARKLTGRASGSMPASRPASAPTPASAPDPPVRSAPGGPMASMQSSRLVREEAERVAKVALFVKAGEDSLARDDLIGALNSFVVAASLAPGDAALRVRADDLQQRVAASMADRHVQQAQVLERSGRFDLAAAAWQKALQGRPKDVVILVRGALCLVHTRTELSRAADLARRALAIAPRSVEATVALAEVYLAGGLKASALGAAEAASKLDPMSPVVKDLLVRVKG